MTPDRDTIHRLVLATIDELNDELPPDEQLESKPDAALFGKGGKLDSLGVIDLAMILQQKIADETGAAVSPFSAAAMSEGENPFATVDSLVTHVTLLIDQNKAA